MRLKQVHSFPIMEVSSKPYLHLRSPAPTWKTVPHYYY